MRYGSVQNAEIHLFCSENRNFLIKKISRKIKPYLWFSLHDTSPNVKAAKRVVYCHNPTPFYVPKMSDLWCNYKEFFFLYSIVIYIK